jgi:chromosome segregation ATPase
MSAADPEKHDLRYRRLGGGYHRQDVEEALQQLLTTVGSVQGTIELLRRRTAQLEAELAAAREELEAYHTRDAWVEATIRRAEDVLARAVAE